MVSPLLSPRYGKEVEIFFPSMDDGLHGLKLERTSEKGIS
jgi:hypothetical protein